MKKIHLFFILAVISIALVLSGCKVDTVSPPATSTATATPTTVQVSLSTSTIPNSGTTTVTATVLDGSSVVMPNVSVSFTVISSTAGSFNPAPVVTNTSGQAVSVFTAGAAVDATATIRASVTVGTTTISGTAPITIGTPLQVPATVIVSLGTTTNWIANGGNTTVTATVRDASSLPIPGATVTFTSAPAAAGSFTAAALTDVNGQTIVTFTAAAAGNNSVIDISAAAGTVSNSASLTIGTPPAPTPASISLSVNPMTMNISSQTAISVTLLTATGSPAYSNPVTLTITTGAGLASFSSSTIVSTWTVTTNTSGAASATVYSGTSSGSVTIQATSGGLTPASVSLSITSNPNSMTLTAVNPNLLSGQTTNVSANVLNLANNPVSDGTVVSFAITAGSTNAGTLSAAQATTVNGIASVTFTASSANTGSLIITASAGSSPVVQATTLIIVNAAQAGSIQFVSAAPDVINISGAGESASLVTFKVLDSNGNPLANQNVNFQLNGPQGAFLSANSASTNAQGEVSTYLNSGSVAGPVNIIATTNVTGPPAATLMTSSGAISIGGGVPSYKWFSLSVEKFNIDGLNCDNVTTTIFVNMADRFGNYNILEGTSVSFATPYGAIDTSNVTNAQGQTESVFRSQTPRPSDGVVRILVHTTGEENFTDLDADGVYSSGTDTFSSADDLPEPFVDNDHNTVHDTGEIYFNWPAGITGATTGYNAANGVWDTSIPIWRTVDIWLTGAPSVAANRSHIECINPATGLLTTGNISIARGTSTVCYVYGADVNNNALIGGTTLTFESTSSSAAIDWVSGFETYADHAVSGPEITGYTVTNNTTTGTTTTLKATINWPGTCGALAVSFSYPGTISLP